MADHLLVDILTQLDPDTLIIEGLALILAVTAALVIHENGLHTFTVQQVLGLAGVWGFVNLVKGVVLHDVE